MTTLCQQRHFMTTVFQAAHPEMARSGSVSGCMERRFPDCHGCLENAILRARIDLD